MDPHPNPRRNSAYLNDNTPGVPANDPNPNPSRDAPDSGNPQPTDRQPQHSGAFTVFPPNESRRSKIKMIAQKEEEDLQRWKEANRVTSVHMNPEMLGGNATLAEAREKQFTGFSCSKLQKKLRKKDLDKSARQEEEEKFQKKKAAQREKAERLQERTQQEEQRRGEQFMQDHLRKTDSFLQRFEGRAPGPLASSRATHTSSRRPDAKPSPGKLASEAVESTQRGKQSKSFAEVQLEHKRVNSAFLDKLEGQGRGSEKEEGVLQAECPFSASADFRHQPSNAPGQQVSLAHLNPDPEQSSSDCTEEADPEPDYDWALMKLMNSFPDCCKVFLEDILVQCNGDYEQAYTLLMASLS